jgi:hypothetical protein
MLLKKGHKNKRDREVDTEIFMTVEACLEARIVQGADTT